MFDEIGKVASFINKLEAIMVKFENVPRLGTFRWDKNVVPRLGRFANYQCRVDPVWQHFVSFFII